MLWYGWSWYFLHHALVVSQDVERAAHSAVVGWVVVHLDSGVQQPHEEVVVAPKVKILR